MYKLVQCLKRDCIVDLIFIFLFPLKIILKVNDIELIIKHKT